MWTFAPRNCIQIEFIRQQTDGFLSVSRFKPKSDAEKYSNMVVLEVAMPSGFTTEKETLNQLLLTDDVKLIETKRGETAVDIYFDKMTANEEKCLVVDGYRVHKVAEQKPVAVRIYDYYDNCK